MLPRSQRDDERLRSLGLIDEQIQTDLHEIQALLASSRQVRGIRRLSSMSEDALAARRTRGEARSGRELADLDLYYKIEVQSGLKQAEVESLLANLNAFDSIEIAEVEPPSIPAGDIFPATPNYDALGFQGYLEPAAAGGIDARYAWTVPGGKGQGTHLIDVEVGWRTTHEDLPVLFYQGGAPYAGESEEHGTSVLGEIVAPDNGYGVTGIAHQASAGVERVGTGVFTFEAILEAADRLEQEGVGGIIVIELHQPGSYTPKSPCPCAPFETCDFVPKEINSANWDAIASATAGGTIVIEAAGNGATDLDDPVYNGWFSRDHDSGAILVGAGNSGPDRSPTCFTNYGSRVDVHAWGWNVVTLGYGDLFDGNNDPNQYYTAVFDGTSSATPIVSGAAASLQGVALAHGLGPLSPSSMRQILRDSGTPQVPGPKQVGPQPDLRAAIDVLLDTPPSASFTSSHTGRSYTFDGTGSTDDLGIVSWSWSFGDGATGTGSVVGHTYAASGSYTVTLTVTDTGGHTGSKQLAVVVDIPPVANLTLTCSGLYCEGNASASTDDFPGLTYGFSWTGGTPGSYSSNSARTHSYSVPGPYTVVMTVRDSIGQTNTISLLIDVHGTTAADTVGNDKTDNEAKLRLYHESGSGTPVKVAITGITGRGIAGDWNGDHVSTLGRYVASTATFYLRNTNSNGAADVTFNFGTAGANWIPIAGDWNNDGVDTVGLYDPSTGTFRLRNSNSAGPADVTFSFTGASSSWLPIAGDWNCNGVDTVGLYNPATATFYLRNSNTSGGSDLTFVFGTPGGSLLPNAGDWNGDGWDSIGVYDPVTGTYWLRDLNNAGAADHQFIFSTSPASRPLAGDWDGI